MKKKYVKYNLLIASLLLLVISYQSLHIFLHSEDHSSYSSNANKTEQTTYKKIFTQKDECPVCEFEFAAFLSSEIFSFEFIPPQHNFFLIDYYKSIVKEKEFLFYSHRGPPILC
ncbi:hypothetical protein [Flavobacterium sp.]|jgi:hypothetical protein|uniref:hypothetical protein n=1 Tax=Flavobacterium sp. TaxID=239 RepID=UPI0037C08C9A